MATLRIAASLMNQADARSFLRYATVGVAQNAAFYGMGLILLWIGLRAWQVTAVSYPAATLISFVANRRWTFTQRMRDPKSLQKYILVYTAVYPAAVAATRLQELFGLPGWLAILNTTIAAVFGLFLLLNHWVFPHARRTLDSVTGTSASS
jgi:putative flippase GtrA